MTPLRKWCLQRALGMEELFWKENRSPWGRALAHACILCTLAPLQKCK